MCKEKESNKGFTFVELLVCVAILAIISFPLLNSFVVAGRTNERAKAIQRSTTLAQNVMETLKGKSLEETITTFRGGNLGELNITDPYITTNSFVNVLGEDTLNGKYQYCIKRVKDGKQEYDVYVTLDASKYKSAGLKVQNNYEMPKITSLQGKKVATIDPDGQSSSWNSYVDADGKTQYTKDTSTSMDHTALLYFYNLHLAYLDLLTMENQKIADEANAARIAAGLTPNVTPAPLPEKYPYTYEQLSSFIKKETVIEAKNGQKADGSIDTSIVNLIATVTYSIAGEHGVTKDSAGISTRYQVLSKVYRTTDGSNPLEQIYLIYDKSGFSDDVIRLNNNSSNSALVNIVNQAVGTVNVIYNDLGNRWGLTSNSVVSFRAGSQTVSNDIVGTQGAKNRIYEILIEVYGTDTGIKTGKKYIELSSTKGE